MESFDAVVIGGGCVGTSTLFHLAQLGCTDTVLLEQGSLGCGSTSKAAGGIRLQHGEEINTRITLRSLAELTRFEEVTGEPIFFHQDGYLICFDDEADFTAFADSAQVQRRLGIPTEVLTPEQAGGLVPGLVTEDLVGATYCPWEGYASPEAVVSGYASAARRLGAQVRTGQEVLSIVTEGDRVVGVETTEGPIATDVVVVAAGVASSVFGPALGTTLPVEGLARAIFYSTQDGGVPDRAPLVVDFGAGFYFHREGPGLLFGGRESDLSDLAEPATHRLPAISDVDISSSWWGYYDMSPDHSALIGAGPVAGGFYATGFSGHGFMQSPAVGEHVAQLVLGREPTLDLSGLSVDRLSVGVSRQERYSV